MFERTFLCHCEATGQARPKQSQSSKIASLTVFARNDGCKKGFTLVELMIVLVIIAIVASVAAMSALAARVRANEANALSALKAVASASEMYRSVQSSYPNNLSVLGPDYLAQDLASGQKSGYSFTLVSGNQGATYTCTTVPIALNYTGVKSYCISLLNAIHVYQNAPALSADGSECPSGGTIMS